MGPPLPGSMGWSAWNLGEDGSGQSVWLLDDLDQPQGQMRAMAMGAPSLDEGGGDGETNGSFTSNQTPPDYGTNLWLEITNIADGAVNLLLHNSQPGVPYELLSKQTLLDAQWVSEGMVTGVDNDILTPAMVNIGERADSLFIRALSWLTVVQSSVTVTLDSLSSDQWNKPSVNVTGTVSDPSCIVTVNGTNATVDEYGNWEADNVPVSATGTAVFDVEVYSGSSFNAAVRPNLAFNANNTPNNTLIDSQKFILPQPLKVILQSVWSDILMDACWCVCSPQRVIRSIT